ncbi:Methyltransferase domain-containing protein [Desulforamulus putei DSM 12395]|uniref:Methyltransferase domain-containing protein n=1 Tax=Desulforamulus putei DSM 12395 TaxID=1121429 RepID=A0A1M4VJ55_9FIRM|nr:class I SAM-dependent methyltransferase [Desulforamulus putei]SHE68872.1 Methyltransferase domain-containing protein [Desulforamulus putei DSM 12395]
MLLVQGKTIAGNFYDKYHSKNPITKYLMKGFYNAISDLVLLSGVSQDVHEVGCGEGHLTSFINKLVKTKIRGSDFSESIIAKAQENYRDINFKVASIYSLEENIDSAELVVCCEVLEHLERPEEALVVLSKITRKYCLLSVPREPIWRLLNMARGRYLKNFGNTPGHIQFWTKGSFIRMVRNYFEIVEVRTPLPWTVVLCKKRGN